MHLSDHIQNLPVQLRASPPPDDMDFNNGENNPEPHEAIQGDAPHARTLYHPILNGMLFILAFLFYFQLSFL
jgi:hypothetical protein